MYSSFVPNAVSTCRVAQLGKWCEEHGRGGCASGLRILGTKVFLTSLRRHVLPDVSDLITFLQSGTRYLFRDRASLYTSPRMNATLSLLKFGKSKATLRAHPYSDDCFSINNTAFNNYPIVVLRDR